jgi:hypothetical protein
MEYIQNPSSAAVERRERSFPVRLHIVGLLFLLASALMICLPLIITKVDHNWALFKLDVWKPNEIGDTIGGILGPAVGLIGAALTFLAFYAQMKANDAQKSQFLKSDKDTSIQRFENKFYILLDLHRQNVSEISIDSKITSRKAFISMYLELRFLWTASEKFYHEDYIRRDSHLVCSEWLRFQVCYLVFFFGIGDNSSQMLHDLVDNVADDFIKGLERCLTEHQAAWKTHYDENSKRLAQNRRFHTIKYGGHEVRLNILYRPFTGHASRLSHYIRHLYQTVKFVDEQEDKTIDDKSKYDYLTNLRAQLSVHEQVLIYYNSLSVLGYPWRGKSDHNRKDFLSVYCLIKSMPLPLANFYKEPLQNGIFQSKNTDGREMFEWTEIKSRLANEASIE